MAAIPARTSVLDRTCIPLRSRTRRSRSNGPFGLFLGLHRPSDPPDRETPGAAALEELVRVHLVRPAEEVRLRLVLCRAPDGRALVRRPLRVQRLAALECVDARLRLFGDGPFLVTARHEAECTLGACPPRPPFADLP